MEDPTPKDPGMERIGKADDCRISERLAHIQLTSFNLHTILGMPEVKGMNAPVLPAMMPRSVTEADKLQVKEDGGLLGSCAPLTDVMEGNGLEKAHNAFAWLENLRERVKTQQQTCEQRAVICDQNEGLGELQGLSRVPSKGRRMSKPTPQKPAKKLRIVVHPPTTEHEEDEIHSAPIVCPSKRTAQLKGETLPIPAERTLRTSASFPGMSKISHMPSGLSNSLQQRSIQQPADMTPSTGELPRKADLEPGSTEHQSHLAPMLTALTSSQALISSTTLPTASTFAPASPPRPYLSPRSHYLPIHQPLHWTSHLSTTLQTWLSHPDTLAVQHPIQELTLTASAQPWAQPSGGARLLSQFEGMVRHKMKFTRILLPFSVSQEFADRDWIILSCTQRPIPAAPVSHTPALRSSTSVLRPRFISPPTSPGLVKHREECAPYFLLAIPVSALRTWSVTYPHSASLAPPMVEPVYPYDSSTAPHAEFSGPKDPAKRPHRTRMLVHSPGIMPLVHGKGTSPTLLMDWVGVVARGQGGGGICQVRSLGPVPGGGGVFGA
ncbi:hypothetical protein B0A48_04414 [Cryoendolithus antarcticus]|uniref:Uncharacterized protein n=1 Tax=Cryoendolithus antarcticus TaxID=1507870 RepID=A0A1V8TFM4_9PEZI|nr:hypothetical protein B0A48_04414 [Cryoendolithus antarcticus]